MPNLRYILLLFFFLFHLEIKAQSYTILEPDTSKFPIITAIIQFNSTTKPLETDFKILDEDKSELEFTFNQKGGEGSAGGGRLIFFLIDASNFTDGLPVENFKKSVIESLDLVGEKDLVNVGYFGKERDDGRALYTLSTEFTSNVDLLKSEIRTRISAVEDSAAVSDAFKAIYEAMDFINSSPDEGQKVLIVVSSAIENPNSVFKTNDIIERSQRLGIPVHTVNYKVNNQYAPDIYKLMSDRTDGIPANARSSSDIKNAIGNFLEKRQESKESEIQQYAIIFETKIPADGELHQFTIQYKDEPPEVINYTAPSGKIGGSRGNEFLRNYGIIIFIIIGLVIGLAVWQYNEYRLRKAEELEAEEEFRREKESMEMGKEHEKESLVRDLQERNIRLQEQLRAKELELAKQLESVPTVIPPDKYDLKNTKISGGGGSPVLMVSAGVFSKNFRLNKPTMTIGRNANNDIVIPEQTVSGHHATITIESGSFFLNDLNSTNGTFVNGNRVEKKILKSGDIIKFGASNCRFEL